jgi:hypothetical protein
MPPRLSLLSRGIPACHGLIVGERR